MSPTTSVGIREQCASNCSTTRPEGPSRLDVGGRSDGGFMLLEHRRRGPRPPPLVCRCRARPIREASATRLPCWLVPESVAREYARVRIAGRARRRARRGRSAPPTVVRDGWPVAHYPRVAP